MQCSEVELSISVRLKGRCVSSADIRLPEKGKSNLMARGRSTKSLDDELDLDLLVVNKELSHSASVPAFPTSKRVLYKRLSLLGGSSPSGFKTLCRDYRGRGKAT